MWRPRQMSQARTFDIGKVVDSADDMARLMIVTQYDGSKTVKVFAHDLTRLNGCRLSKANTIQLEVLDTGDDAGDDVFANLKAA